MADETEYKNPYSYGSRQVETDDLIALLEDKAPEFVSQMGLSDREAEEFYSSLSDYLDAMGEGRLSSDIAGVVNDTAGVLKDSPEEYTLRHGRGRVVNGEEYDRLRPGRQSRAVASFRPNNVVAKFIDRAARELANRPAEETPKEKFDWGKNGLWSSFMRDLQPNGTPNLNVWLDTDPYDEVTGKRGLQNRIGRFGEFLNRYIEGLPEEMDFSGVGTNWTRDEYVGMLNQLKDKLASGNIDNDFYLMLDRLGSNSENYMPYWTTKKRWDDEESPEDELAARLKKGVEDTMASQRDAWYGGPATQFYRSAPKRVPIETDSDDPDEILASYMRNVNNGNKNGGPKLSFDANSLRQETGKKWAPYIEQYDEIVGDSAFATVGGTGRYSGWRVLLGSFNPQNGTVLAYDPSSGTCGRVFAGGLDASMYDIYYNTIEDQLKNTLDANGRPQYRQWGGEVGDELYDENAILTAARGGVLLYQQGGDIPDDEAAALADAYLANAAAGGGGGGGAGAGSYYAYAGAGNAPASMLEPAAKPTFAQYSGFQNALETQRTGSARRTVNDRGERIAADTGTGKTSDYSGSTKLRAVDIMRISSMAADIAAMIDPEGISSACLAYGSDGVSLAADLMDEDVSTGKAIGNFALNAALSTIAFIPVIGGTAKAGSLLKTATKLAKPLMYMGLAAGAFDVIENGEDVMNSLKKLIHGNKDKTVEGKMTLNDWRNIYVLASTLIGGSHVARTARAKGVSRKVGKTNDVDVVAIETNGTGKAAKSEQVLLKLEGDEAKAMKEARSIGGAEGSRKAAEIISNHKEPGRKGATYQIAHMGSSKEWKIGDHVLRASHEKLDFDSAVHDHFDTAAMRAEAENYRGLTRKALANPELYSGITGVYTGELKYPGAGAGAKRKGGAAGSGKKGGAASRKKVAPITGESVGLEKPELLYGEIVEPAAAPVPVERRLGPANYGRAPRSRMLGMPGEPMPESRMIGEPVGYMSASERHAALFGSPRGTGGEGMQTAGNRVMDATRRAAMDQGYVSQLRERVSARNPKFFEGKGNSQYGRAQKAFSEAQRYAEANNFGDIEGDLRAYNRYVSRFGLSKSAQAAQKRYNLDRRDLWALGMLRGGGTVVSAREKIEGCRSLVDSLRGGGIVKKKILKGQNGPAGGITPDNFGNITPDALGGLSRDQLVQLLGVIGGALGIQNPQQAGQSGASYTPNYGGYALKDDSYYANGEYGSSSPVSGQSIYSAVPSGSSHGISGFNSEGYDWDDLQKNTTAARTAWQGDPNNRANDFKNYAMAWLNDHPGGTRDQLLRDYNADVQSQYDYKRWAAGQENQYFKGNSTKNFNDTNRRLYGSANSVGGVHGGYDENLANINGSTTAQRFVDITDDDVRDINWNFGEGDSEELQNLLNGLSKNKYGFWYYDNPQEAAAEEGDGSTTVGHGNGNGPTGTVPLGGPKGQGQDKGQGAGDALGAVGSALAEASPDLLRYGNLARTLRFNRWLERQRPWVQLDRPAERHEQVIGDYGAMMRGNKQAAQMLSKTRRAAGADIDKNMANMLDATIQAGGYREQGAVTNDTALQNSIASAKAVEAQNLENREKARRLNMDTLANYNESLRQNRVAARRTATESLNNFQQGFINRIENRLEEEKPYREYYQEQSIRNEVAANLKGNGISGDAETQRLFNGIMNGTTKYKDLTASQKQKVDLATAKYNQVVNQRLAAMHGARYTTYQGAQNGVAGAGSVADIDAALDAVGWNYRKDEKTETEAEGGVLGDQTKADVQRTKVKVSRMQAQQRHMEKRMDAMERELDRMERSGARYLNATRKSK